MSEELKKVSSNLSTRENIAGIVWLCVGICQCLTIVGFFAGIWNIIAAFSRFKQAKAVMNPWQGIVGTYDKWLGKLIRGFVISMIVGLFIGGVPSLFGFLYDLIFIRSYVLNNKAVYARAGL